MKKEKISVNGQIISQMRHVNESGKMYKAYLQRKFVLF
jgi:hypothetical protein